MRGRRPLLRVAIDAAPKRAIERLKKEGKPAQLLLRVNVDSSGLLDAEADELDAPQGAGGCGNLLVLLMILSGLAGFAGALLGFKTA